MEDPKDQPGKVIVTAWNRLSREASIASLGKWIAAAIAITIMAAVGHGPTHTITSVLYGWLGVGALSVAMQAGVPWMKVNANWSEIPYLLVMGMFDYVALVAVVALTGGVSGPFWVLMLLTTAGAAVIAPTRWIAVAQAIFMDAGLVLATWIAHDLTSKAPDRWSSSRCALR